MSKLFKKISILAGIFVMAAGIYFILAQNTIEKSDTVYTTMEEARLPVVYTHMFGLETNRMPGYLQEMEQKTARDSLTILPADRQLKLRIADYGTSILSVQYEIRSMDLSRLVEKTVVTDWTESENGTFVTLPIQNLLTKDSEYMLHLILQTETNDAIHYYTRIKEETNLYGEEMVKFAGDFSAKTLSPEQAQSLVTYLETSSTEDNSSFGHVTIRSSFSQLTWGGLKMRLDGDFRVTLMELDGIMGQVLVQYSLTRESEEGITEYYDVTDHYTLKHNTKRLFLMNFQRTTNQVFDGGRELYSGKRILLGVGNDDTVNVRASADRRFLAYTFNRDLWSFDQTDGKAVRVFSFRSKDDSSGRSSYGRHDIQIVSVRDTGDIDFLVYGYMNRGKHEGYTGVSLCRYDQSTGAVEEKFFIPVMDTYESIKQDVEQLSYLSSTDMLYILIDQAVYGIDLTSNEYMVVADALEDGSYSISEDRHSLAWQEGQKLYESQTLHVLNLESGQKQEITADDDSYLRVLGYVRSDFVYGLAHPGDLWVVNGRVETLPMYAIEIVDENLDLETRYERDGVYLADVETEDARIHMSRLVKGERGGFVYQDKDTIVCNTATEEDNMAGIGWFASEVRRKLYFIQLDNDIKTGKNIKISAPKKITYDKSENLELRANQVYQGIRFYAYGEGHLLGSSRDFTEAVQMAYGRMGYVVDHNQRIVWDRINRSASRTLRDPQSAAYSLTKHLEEFTTSQDFGDGKLLLDARGCTLSQMLYFIDRGIPVLAYTEENRYMLLYGFDQYNISILDPVTDQTSKMGLNDAGEYFARYGNDFICAVSED